LHVRFNPLDIVVNFISGTYVHRLDGTEATADNESTGLYNRGGSPSVQQRCSLKHSRERTAMLQAMATQIGYAATYCIPNRAEFCLADPREFSRATCV